VVGWYTFFGTQCIYIMQATADRIAYSLSRRNTVCGHFNNFRIVANFLLVFHYIVSPKSPQYFLPLNLNEHYQVSICLAEIILKNYPIKNCFRPTFPPHTSLLLQYLPQPRNREVASFHFNVVGLLYLCRHVLWTEVFYFSTEVSFFLSFLLPPNLRGRSTYRQPYSSEGRI